MYNKLLENKVIEKFGKIKRLSYIESDNKYIIVHWFQPCIKGKTIKGNKIKLLRNIIKFLSNIQNKPVCSTFTMIFVTDWKD